MATLELTPEERSHLEQVAQVELSRRGWKLALEPTFFVAPQGFYDRIEARLRERWEERQQPVTDETIRRATFYEYCCLLCAAFKRNGTRVQTIAFDEAYHYTWPYIIRRCADTALAQNVLMLTLTTAWQKIDQCQTPGAFLAWFVQIAINHLNGELKRLKKKKMEVNVDDLPNSPDPDDDRSSLEILLDHFGVQHDVIDELLRGLSYPSLVKKLRRCLNSVLQESILIASYYLEMQVSEMVRLFNVPAAVISTNKFQAIRKIRDNCPYVIEELRGLLS